ncbi:hypothetical protein BGX34_000790 [Mortierella sp. NVP85]|nr:hypothetical protein BGX34_000790 [Mortierella sp. NVP85]
MNIKFALFATVVLVLVSIVSAQYAPATTPLTPLIANLTLTIRLGNVFCLFLPDGPGGTIAQGLSSAIAYCTCKPSFPFASHMILPEGFIRSVHYYEHPTKYYVQVTGRFDRSKFGFPRSDPGGQIDPSVRALSNCYGYKYYVQLTEPDTEEYCLRCCYRPEDCPTNKATKGCRAALPGKYD